MSTLFPETNVDTALQTVPLTPLSLIERILDGNGDVTQLAQLFALQKDFEAWEAKKAFNSAMVACQAEMPEVMRNKLNKQTGSWYADIEAVHKAIKPVYVKHGFSCSHDSDTSPLPNHYRWIVHVMHSGGHVEQRHIDLPTDDEGIKGGKCKTAVQGVASTSTYSQRYLECRAFNVTIPGLDKDGNRPASPVATITDEQVAKLNEWLIDKDVKLDDFLKWAECDALDALPAAKYMTAIDMLKRRQAGAKR